MKGHARRRDKNEPTIVEALEAAGAVVQRLGERGVPDLLVGYQGRTFLIEVKNPDGKRRSNSKGDVRSKRGAFTRDQAKWFTAWKGAPIVEVINGAEALAAIRLTNHQLRKNKLESDVLGDSLAKAMYP